MKIRKIIGICAGIVVIAAAMVMIFFYLHEPFPVECIDLSVTEITALQKVINTYQEKVDYKLRLISIDSDNNSSKIINTKKGAYIGYLNENLRQNSDKYGNVPEDLIKRTARSVQSTVRRNNNSDTYWALPLVMDHLEFFTQQKSVLTEKNGITTPEQVLKLVPEIDKKTRYQAVIAGKDDDLLLDIIGQIVASTNGYEAYTALCSQSLDVTAPEAFAASQPAFTEAIHILSDWQKSKWLHPNWLDLNVQSSQKLIEMKQALFVIQTLEQHRQIDRSVLTEGKATRFLEVGTKTRIMTAPTIVGCIPIKGRWVQAAQDFLSWLMSEEGQKVLSQDTGLAPTVLSIAAPDTQAREVRSWASASQIIQGWSKDGFTDKKTRTEFAAKLREYIQRNK